MKGKNQTLERGIKFAVLILSLILPAIISFLIYSIYQTTASSLDAFSHLYIPKNIIHNGINSTIKNLGTVWLPFYHILLLPLVAFNQLYFTGLAGTIWGTILLFLITSIILRFLAFPENIFASLIFILHPYILLFTITPMNEILTIFLLLFTAFHFYQFLEKDKGLTPVIIGVILGTLTRYEFYPIPFLILPFLIKRKKEKGNWLKLITLSVFLFSGIIFWVFWNQFLFSDPLFFFRHPVTKDVVGTLTYAKSLSKVWNFHWRVTKELFGILPIFSTLGIILLLIKGKIKLLLTLLLLITPFFTHFFLAYQNISLGYARFFLLSFPGFLLFAFVLAREFTISIGKRFVPPYFFSLIIFLLCLPTLKVNYPVLKIGRNHYYSKINIPDLDINYPRTSSYLKTFQHFFSGIKMGKGQILIPFNQEFQVISFALHLSPEQIFDSYDGQSLLLAMEKPAQFCDFILFPISPTPFCSIFQKYYKGKYFVLSFLESESYQKEILSHFTLIREGEGLRLYKKRTAIDF